MGQTGPAAHRLSGRYPGPPRHPWHWGSDLLCLPLHSQTLPGWLPRRAARECGGQALGEQPPRQLARQASGLLGQHCDECGRAKRVAHPPQASRSRPGRSQQERSQQEWRLPRCQRAGFCHVAEQQQGLLTPPLLGWLARLLR